MNAADKKKLSDDLHSGFANSTDWGTPPIVAAIDALEAAGYTIEKHPAPEPWAEAAKPLLRHTCPQCKTEFVDGTPAPERVTLYCACGYESLPSITNDMPWCGRAFCRGGSSNG